MGTDVVCLVAGIDGARHAVVAVGGHPGLATERRVTRLVSGAIQSVTACSVIGRIHAGISRFVTGIDRAVHAVVADHRRSGLAALGWMTEFRSVAVLPVTASSVIGGVFTGVGGGIAAIDGTRDTIVTGGRRAGHARSRGHVAGFDAVAEYSVVALRIVDAIDATVIRLIANRRRVARIDAIDAAQNRIADFLPVTKQTVATGQVIGSMDTGVSGFIARIHRAGQPIGAVDGRSNLTPLGGVAGLTSVAVETVAASGMIGNVVAGIGGLIAGIGGAGNAIGTSWRRPGLTALGGMTELGTIAIQPIVTSTIVRQKIA